MDAKQSPHKDFRYCSLCGDHVWLWLMVSFEGNVTSKHFLDNSATLFRIYEILLTEEKSDPVTYINGCFFKYGRLWKPCVC